MATYSGDVCLDWSINYTTALNAKASSIPFNYTTEPTSSSSDNNGFLASGSRGWSISSPHATGNIIYNTGVGKDTLYIAPTTAQLADCTLQYIALFTSDGSQVVDDNQNAFVADYTLTQTGAGVSPYTKALYNITIKLYNPTGANIKLNGISQASFSASIKDISFTQTSIAVSNGTSSTNTNCTSPASEAQYYNGTFIAGSFNLSGVSSTNSTYTITVSAPISSNIFTNKESTAYYDPASASTFYDVYQNNALVNKLGTGHLNSTVGNIKIKF